jgi:hypothetical protein
MSTNIWENLEKTFSMIGGKFSLSFERIVRYYGKDMRIISGKFEESFAVDGGEIYG